MGLEGGSGRAQQGQSLNRGFCGKEGPGLVAHSEDFNSHCVRWEPWEGWDKEWI